MEKVWWKEAIAYQIYVRSFKDTNGDGIGDIKGIIEKLDYLKELGVDTIYLNPINKSPNDDNGYDISDFEDIMDEFGTLDDFDLMIKEIHDRGMKFIMDLVLNHSSDEHPWFKEAIKSKDNPYRDYYIWQEGKGDKVPNNWGSFFGGSAWEKDPNSNEYYLHLFSKKQPDLNWANPKVREELTDMIQFWIDKGVDGFRMDAINHLAKDTDFPNGIVHEGEIYGDFIRYVQNLPECHEYLKELRKKLHREGLVWIGETGGIGYHNAKKYTGVKEKQLDFTFHFDLHSVGKGKEAWERQEINLIKDIKANMSGWQRRSAEEGWNPLFYSNHDTTRTVSRLGCDKDYHKESAKMLAVMQLTQKGTPFIYYGDEIGMTNAWDFKLEDYRDVSVFNIYNDKVKSGMISEENYIKGLHNTSRDNSRTPMQWDNTEFGGFSVSEPWIGVNSNKDLINVINQERDLDSILNFYKRVIKLRKESTSLIYGKFKEHNKRNSKAYAYSRIDENEEMLVICNFFGSKTGFKLDNTFERSSKLSLILSNYEKVNCTLENFYETYRITLRPYEALIFRRCK